MALTPELLRLSWKSWISGDIAPVGPGWLQWLWTLLFAAAVAFGFTLLGFAFNARGADWFKLSAWMHWYRVNFIVSITISVSIHLLFALLIPWVGRARIARFSSLQRAGFFMGIPLSGLCVGWPLGVWFVSDEARGWVRLDNPGNVVGAAMLALSISFVFFLYFNARASQAVAERRATEAQLRLLQGQIEPHFLFNTLANVQALMDHEPAKARQMLHDFTEYLRCSLATLRSDTVPLAHELDLAESYLRLLGARMDDRLRWTLAADEAARAVPVPPLLLQPLVENAIHHGLEPQLAGGCLKVRAQVQGHELVLEVHDDGRGPDAPPRPGVRKGHGLALQNIRERLHSRYGGDASLVLSAAHPGTRVLIRLPIAAPSAPAASTAKPQARSQPGEPA